VFRPLTDAEEEDGYQIICDTVEWLRSKDIDLWRKPLPREVYAARQQRAENYGLFADGQLAAIVSLVHTRNLPSCRVAERNGMRVVAEITRANLPHHVYAITRAEWRQLR